jgi:hypothetical protein
MAKKPTACRNIKASFLKKPHKPVSPAIAIAVIAGVFAVFIIILGLKVWISLPHPIQTPARNEYLSLNPTQPPSQPTTYHSRFMQIAFRVPSGFQLTDKAIDITLKNDEGEIDIGSNGTNYTTLDGYLRDLSQKNHFTLTQRQELVINHLPAISGFIGTLINNTPEYEKVYFFYPAPFSVVTISTKSPALYSTLDQVARSIKFLP